MHFEPFSVAVRIEGEIVNVTIAPGAMPHHGEVVEFANLEGHALEVITRPEEAGGKTYCFTGESDKLTRPLVRYCFSCGTRAAKDRSNYCQLCDNRRNFGTPDGYN